jgi:predicted RNA binding protein YcfA (HicA-like mRNA interferase family)
MREAIIQKEIIKWLENEGWYVVKIIQTNKNGWPDIQIHADGITIFIEVKSENGKVSELQKYRHKQLQEKGFYIIITSSLNNLQHELTTICNKLRIQGSISNSN